MRIKSAAKLRFASPLRMTLLFQVRVIFESHAVVIWAATALRGDPGDDLVRVHDVAGLAVYAVGEVHRDLFCAGHIGSLNHFVNFGGTEVLARIAVLDSTACVADVSVMDDEVHRLIVIVLSARMIDIGELIEGELAITLDGAEHVLASVATGRKNIDLLKALVTGMRGI